MGDAAVRAVRGDDTVAMRRKESEIIFFLYVYKKPITVPFLFCFVKRDLIFSRVYLCVPQEMDYNSVSYSPMGHNSFAAPRSSRMRDTRSSTMRCISLSSSGCCVVTSCQRSQYSAT